VHLLAYFNQHSTFGFVPEPLGVFQLMIVLLSHLAQFSTFGHVSSHLVSFQHTSAPFGPFEQI